MVLQTLFFIFAFLVGAELALHIIYFAWTGRSGLNDPPFAYLREIFTFPVKNEGKQGKLGK